MPLKRNHLLITLVIIVFTIIYLSSSASYLRRQLSNPIPTPTPTPPTPYDVLPNQDTAKTYACTPSGTCAVYQDPITGGGCPVVFTDQTCNHQCQSSKNRCLK